MSRTKTWAVILVLVLAPVVSGQGTQPAVESVLADWKDGNRNVTVPVKIYYPGNIAQQKAPLPLIIFSHGLGGSREGYGYWAEHWAAAGYIVLLPTHVGSDTSAALAVVRGGDGRESAPAAGASRGMRDMVEGSGGQPGFASLATVQNAYRRCRDISFCIDQMSRVNQSGGTPSGGSGGGAGGGGDAGKPLAVLQGKVDMSRIGISGHSFGAETTLSIAGETFAFGRRSTSMADPRVKAAIAMSPQPSGLMDQKVAFSSITIPVLHMTGTADDSPVDLSDVKAMDRRVPFDNSTAPGTCLVIFNGARHMSFAPSRTGALREIRLPGEAPSTQPALSPEKEAAVQNLVVQCTTAFWNAHLKDDAAANTWLTNQFPKVLGTAGTFEIKAGH